MPGVQNRFRLRGTTSRRYWRMPIVVAMSIIFLLVDWSNGGSQRTGPGEPTASRQPEPSTRQIDVRQTKRLQRVMTPLIKNMSHPLRPNKVRVTLLCAVESLRRKN